MVQKHTGPMLIGGSLLVLGFSIFLFVTGAKQLTSEKETSAMVNGYTYVNSTCLVCQGEVFHGLPNCKEYPYTGAILLVFNNCSDVVSANVCGNTPVEAETNTEKLYKIGTKFDGFSKGCKFYFLRGYAQEILIMGAVAFVAFLTLLGLGIYFIKKYEKQNQYQRV